VYSSDVGGGEVYEGKRDESEEARGVGAENTDKREFHLRGGRERRVERLLLYLL
jgi:hypothetical protein